MGEKIIANNFPNVAPTWTHRFASSVYPKPDRSKGKDTLAFITEKLLKSDNKEKISNSLRKQHIIHQVTTHWLLTYHQKQWRPKEKGRSLQIPPTQNSTPVKPCVQNKGRRRQFQIKENEENSSPADLYPKWCWSCQVEEKRLQTETIDLQEAMK